MNAAASRRQCERWRAMRERWLREVDEMRAALWWQPRDNPLLREIEEFRAALARESATCDSDN